MKDDSIKELDATLKELQRSQDEREAFEVHFAGKANFERNKHHPDYYLHNPTRVMWDAWQARATRPQQQSVAEPSGAQDDREAVVVVGWLGGNGLHSEEKEATGAPFPLMTVAQHERIVAALSQQAEPAPAQDERVRLLARCLGVAAGFDSQLCKDIEAAIIAEARPAQTAPQPEQSGLVEMINAAMIEMRNIAPPLRRRDCERLIRAAMAAKEG